tara:strand:+ start:4577 stop:5302 length:726 start_codon:yes stop_codon:yes gene_type:complete
MRVNYNFAFKNSRLRQWKRPSPPNLLITDASLQKKIIYIYKEFNLNSALFYPPSLILLISVFTQIVNIFPNRVITDLEMKHQEYVKISNKISSINSSKIRFNNNVKNIDQYFTQATTTYLFTFHLQKSVPTGVQLNSYLFSDNGFDINASAFSIDSLNQFITLIIESPIIERNSVQIAKLNKDNSQVSSNSNIALNFDLELYGQISKIDIKKRENLYEKSNANGLLKKLTRFNSLKLLLRS